MKNQMTIQLFKIALAKFRIANDLLGAIQDYEDDRFEIEINGDLEELLTIINNEVNQLPGLKLKDIVDYYKFIMASSNFMRHEDLDKIEPLAEFRLNYPCLYATMKIWGWG